MTDGQVGQQVTPEQALVDAVERLRRAEEAEPHADADAEAEYASEMVALAALALVRHLERFPAEQPLGWHDDPVTGPIREPGTGGGMRDYTCGACGSEFGSNCDPGDVACTECEARLCSLCGHWESAIYP